MAEIILKTIEITLDEQSIKRAIKTVENLKKYLAEGLSELARTITEDRGKGIAQMYIAQFPAVDSGALSDSIHGVYNKSNHEGSISTDVEYAVLVEYGTGIVGAQNPHPGIGDGDWINVDSVSIGNKTYSSYDQEGHGEAGWWYPSENGWYEASTGALLAWTKGSPARPFMYMTMKELEMQAEHDGGRIIAQYIP
jgi:hypothetical protein